MNNVIELIEVSKQFKQKQAVDQISLQIAEGSVTAILGPNGAGKTTTLSMMLGLLEPTSGSVRLFGDHPRAAHANGRIGAMLQQVSVMDRLRVRELLALTRSYYAHPLDMEQLISISRLSKHDLELFTEKLSGGQKRSLNFALALAGNPDILFFDEPTVGLDTTARKQFWENTKQLAQQGKTIIFTTHYLQEADDAADRIVLINHGKLIADGTPNEVKSQFIRSSVSFIAEDLNSILIEQLERLFTDYTVDFTRKKITISTDDTDAILRTIACEQLPVHDIQLNQGRLDEAFEQLTLETEEVR